MVLAEMQKKRSFSFSWFNCFIANGSEVKQKLNRNDIRFYAFFSKGLVFCSLGIDDWIFRQNEAETT